MDGHAHLPAQTSTAHTVALPGLLALAMSAATLIVPTLSVLASSLITDIGISRTQLGALVVAASSVAAVFSPVAGKLCDRLGGKRMVLVIHALAIAGVALLASAPNYGLLVAAAATSGLATATGNQAANKVIAVALPVGKRGPTMGIKQSGVQLSVLVAGLMLPAGAAWIGWRGAVLGMAFLPVVGAVAAWVILPAAGPITGRTASHRAGHRYRHDSGVRWVTAYAAFMGVGTSTTLAFLALYAQEGVGATAIGAGLVVSVMGISGAIMRIAWGPLSERSRHLSSPLLALSLLSMVGCATIWSAATLGTPALLVGALVAGGSIMAWNTVANLAAIMIVDDGNVGRASGLVNFGFLGGYSVGPLLFGWSVDTTGHYHLGWAGILVSFAAATALAALWGRLHRSRIRTTSR